ncbi:MAG: cytochrome c biogenesis protein CcsA [Deltaproteobacteria bacterium]|nr:cytochrome c biogenesis protein CcsA [Deltaproteobacteria bacterium]
MPTICILPGLVLYGVATLLGWVHEFGLWPTGRPWGVRLFWTGFLLQTIYLPFAIFWAGAPYFAHRGITIGVLAWGCAAAYAVLLRHPRWQALGSIFFPLIFLLLLLSMMESAPFRGAMHAETTAILPIHLALAMSAMALYVISFLCGVVYLWSERRLKSRRPAARWLRIPSLPVLEGTLGRLLTIGYVILTLTLITGMLLSVVFPGAGSAMGHRWWALGAWVIYGVVLQRRLTRGWRRRWIPLSLAGFAVILFSFLEVHGI